MDRVVRVDRLGMPHRIGLSALSLGAAALHFAVVGDHIEEHVPFGVAFAVVAWLQAAWAVAIVAAPERRLLRLLQAGVVGNLLVIGAWVVSRTAGLPFGPHAGEPEAASAVDVVATSLEMLVVLGCVAVLLAGDRQAHRARPRSSVLAGALATCTVAVTVTVALATSPDHGHDGGSHDGEVAHAGSHHDGGAGHHVVTGSGEPDPAQIAAVRAAMAKYADIDTARAYGWEPEHADEPGIGAHFTRDEEWEDPADDLDLARPQYLMYSRLGRDDWELVAVAYVVDQELASEPPTTLEGAGYHAHVWTCIVDGEELEEDEVGPVSRDDCRDQGGEWSPGGVWMTHVWLIDNPSGVFAETNPALA